MENERLINQIAVGVVFVQGPGDDLTMDNTALLTAAAEVQEGMNTLAGLEPDALVSMVYQHEFVTLPSTATIFPGAPWEGMPKSFYIQPIDAAVYRSSVAKTYLFQGDRYVRLTGATVDSGYPMAIASGWTGLPAAFEAGIDAAFEDTSDGKIYMFKGAEYVRLTGTTVDSGFPQTIVSRWSTLPEEFQSGINAVVMDPSGKIYMFKDDSYVRLTGTTVDANYPKKIKGNFQGVDPEFEARVDAAVWRGDANKGYLFSHADRDNLNTYARFTDFGQPVDAGYPAFVGGLDRTAAEALWRDQALAQLGFASGEAGCIAFTDQMVANLGTDWGFLMFITKYPVYWSAYAKTGRLVIRWNDAATDRDRTVSHEVGHSFGGTDEYAEAPCACTSVAGHFFQAQNLNCEACTATVSMISGYPKVIAGNWDGLPASFQSGIDAAFWNGDNRHNYMFKGNQYIRLSGSTMDPSYPKSIAGNWAGLPLNFQSGIDAAFWRRTDGKVYFFKGSEYVRLTDFAVDVGFPRTIASDFPSLPANFQTGIDAAFWREYNEKIYMFKGTEYCRLTNLTKDVGYPAPIAGNWQGLPAPFTSNVQAALMDPDLAAIYLFNGANYAKIMTGENCLMYNNSPVLCPSSVSHLGLGAFLTRIDAAYHRPDIGKSYLFSGKWYVRYSTVPGTIDAGYPKLIEGNWAGLPASFNSGIDAALWRPSTGKSYFFKGNQYVRITDTTMDATYPKPIAGNWVGIPATFEAGIDAALWRPSNDKIYMFKGSQYIRLTDNVMDASYPATIASGWPGLPASFQSGIDGAFVSTAGLLYMFSDRKYVRFTTVAGGVDVGYPKWIDQNWMPFPRG